MSWTPGLPVLYFWMFCDDLESSCTYIVIDVDLLVASAHPVGEATSKINKAERSHVLLSERFQPFYGV